MNPKNPAYVSPWPVLIGLTVIIASSFVDQAHAPAWLLWMTSLGLGLAWAFFFIRAERRRNATADELELRIRAEGHAMALHLSIATFLVLAQFQHADLLRLDLRHSGFVLIIAYLAGPWIARRRYQ